MKKYIFIVMGLLLCLCGCSDAKEGKETAKPAATTPVAKVSATPTTTPEVIDPSAPQMTLIGHASVKIVTKKGKVIYIDPAYDGDYSLPADYIFVTHEHEDHNNVDLVTTKKGTKTYHYNDFLKKGKYKTIKLDDVKVTSVAAYNSNHPKESCVGYIFEFDGIKLYHAGDTSYIDEMKTLTNLKLDYALLPIDGSYNMDGKEATKCANIIGAKHNVPIHTSTVQSPIDMDNVALFTPSNVQAIEYGKTISLKHN